MAENKDVRIVALKCPNCGGALRVPEGADKAFCEHCKSDVLIVNGGAGRAGIAAEPPTSPEETAATRRMVKLILWVIGIGIVLPAAATVMVNVIIALVSLVLGIALALAGK